MKHGYRPSGGVAGAAAWAAVVALSCAGLPGAAAARTAPQVPATPGTRDTRQPVPGDTVLTTPAGRYDAGALQRWILGSGHRRLWPLPVSAEVLDPERFAGGLTVTRQGGGQQTRSLRFQSADGRVFTFRSIDKDASRSLDPVLRETLAATVVQDQISALFPLSAMVVAPLLRAAGVLHADPRLVVLPDHPALGEHRREFGGLLGWIEERPDEGPDDDPGFAESSRVIGSERLLERLEETSRNRVDAEAFLRARLLDMLVGDWDRHPDQWRWAGFEAGDTLLFQPVPRDRDWALSRLDGLVASLTWIPWPHYVGFSREYPSAFRQTWSGRALDRRILPALERPSWERVLSELEARITDGVIDDAVGRLPPSYREAIGAQLAADLKFRRDGLRSQGEAFYALLSGWVDVHATDEDELARVERLDDGRVVVALHRVVDGSPEPAPWFRRTFLPSETREVRIHLKGGQDGSVVSGSAAGSIVVRLVGGGGRDRLEDRTGSSRVRFYDAGDGTEFVRSGGARVDRRAWTEVPDHSSSTHQASARDWGVRWIPLPSTGFDPEVGFYVGAGVQRTAYGFRHYPYESRAAATLAIGTATGKPRGALELDLPFRNVARAELGVAYEGAELTRFYERGNSSPADRADTYYEARRQTWRARAALATRSADGDFTASVGPAYTSVRARDEPGTLVTELRPYGHGDFRTVALEGDVRWDGRDHAFFPTGGGRVEATARWVPAALDAVEAYGSVGARASAYLSADVALRPTLALRAGGEKVWGDHPYFDDAAIGGAETLRGHRGRRFSGDAALFAGAELRLFLTEFVFLLPGDLGVLGLAEAGRVFSRADGGGTWHPAFGGGAWASFVDAWSMSLAVAASDGGTTVHFGVGMPF